MRFLVFGFLAQALLKASENNRLPRIQPKIGIRYVDVTFVIVKGFCMKKGNNNP